LGNAAQPSQILLVASHDEFQRKFSRHHASCILKELALRGELD
jgi:hypothetical protein